MELHVQHLSVIYLFSYFSSPLIFTFVILISVNLSKNGWIKLFICGDDSFFFWFDIFLLFTWLLEMRDLFGPNLIVNYRNWIKILTYTLLLYIDDYTLKRMKDKFYFFFKEKSNKLIFNILQLSPVPLYINFETPCYVNFRFLRLLAVEYIYNTLFSLIKSNFTYIFLFFPFLIFKLTENYIWNNNFFYMSKKINFIYKTNPSKWKF